MATEVYQQRFSGIQRLYGDTASQILQQAHVCVIGIGGVGSWCAEALARSGVGRITLIDLDDICVTNINRQIHALTDTVGQSKVVVMRQRLLQINPELHCDIIEDFVTAETLSEYLAASYGYDYVIDAIDNVNSKAAMIAHCKRQKLPIMVIGGAGGQSDPTQIQISDLSKTHHDPLLSSVRSKLRRDYGFSKTPNKKFSVDCVFSSEQLMYPQHDGSVCQSKTTAQGSQKMDCANGFGALSCVTGTFAFFAVAHVQRKIIQRQLRRQH